MAAHDVTARAAGGPVAMAVDGCTGWRYVVEKIVAAGFEPHLAEPADMQTARGRKRHARTDRTGCRLLRDLLADGRLPESWAKTRELLEADDLELSPAGRQRVLTAYRMIDRRDHRRIPPAQGGFCNGSVSANRAVGR